MLYKEQYDKKNSKEKLIPSKLLIIGENKKHCPSCGGLQRELVERFATCEKECKFKAKCTRCLYINKGTFSIINRTLTQWLVYYMLQEL